MKTAKRCFIAMLALCLVVAASACGGKEKKMSRGKIDGNVYTNDFAGIRFTKPDDWVYSTDEEIAEVMDVSAELLQQDDFAEKVQDLAVVYDMMAKDLMSGNNINVTFENLTVTGATSITEAQYIEKSIEMIESQASFMNYTFGEPESVELGGHPFTKVGAVGSYSGVSFEQNLYVHKEGNYMVLITLSLFSGSDETVYEAMFS